MSHNKQNQPNSQTILLLGSTGFIGSRVTEKLTLLGYPLRLPNHDEINFDNPAASSLTQVFQGVDMVINMVGVMSQDAVQLEKIHHYSPVQLAKAAKAAGVKRWVNLSALGASTEQTIAFVSSKGRGDAALLALSDRDFSVAIARPSLVFGAGGASCELFIKLAKWPVLLLPNVGQDIIQPVHVDDVAQGLINLVLFGHNAVKIVPQTQAQLPTVPSPAIINFTGSKVGTLADYLTMMRTEIHQLRAPKIIPITDQLAKIGARLAQAYMGGLVTPDSLTLLAAGSVADYNTFAQVLGYEPLGYSDFVNKSFT